MKCCPAPLPSRSANSHPLLSLDDLFLAMPLIHYVSFRPLFQMGLKAAQSSLRLVSAKNIPFQAHGPREKGGRYSTAAATSAVHTTPKLHDSSQAYLSWRTCRHTR